jgi:hypothetical protein
MTNTKRICRLDLNVGDIAHFQGARFEITTTRVYEDKYDNETVMVAIGKWLDGKEITGYFGKDINWNFQGNHLSRVDIETN